MPAKVDAKQTLIDFALTELQKAMQGEHNGTTPNIAKLQQLYQDLLEADKKYRNNELTEADMEKLIEEQVKKITRR